MLNPITFYLTCIFQSHVISSHPIPSPCYHIIIRLTIFHLLPFYSIFSHSTTLSLGLPYLILSHPTSIPPQFYSYFHQAYPIGGVSTSLALSLNSNSNTPADADSPQRSLRYNEKLIEYIINMVLVEYSGI